MAAVHVRPDMGPLSVFERPLFIAATAYYRRRTSAVPRNLACRRELGPGS